ncbi:MAG: RsiV family protein [Bacteroidales bacterium]|nr:RsiV family protein [Bacteroidales bacterium]
MKKGNLSFFAICLSYFIFTTSCEYKTKTVDNTIGFDSIQVDESYHIHGQTSEPGCNIKINFLFPDSTKSTDNLLKTFVVKTYGEPFNNMGPHEATKEFINRYMENFKNFTTITENSEYKEDENIYVDETGYSYYIQLKNNILYNKNNFISFTVESLSYEGGAHSSKSIYGFVYNLTTDKLLQQNDFAGDKYMSSISTILAEKIAEENGIKEIKELENLGYNSLEEIKPNNNFTLDDQGITYYFNENEIAGTMVGISRVFIPYEELNIYTQKDSPISVFTSH